MTPEKYKQLSIKEFTQAAALFLQYLEDILSLFSDQ